MSLNAFINGLGPNYQIEIELKTNDRALTNLGLVCQFNQNHFEFKRVPFVFIPISVKGGVYTHKLTLKCIDSQGMVIRFDEF